MNESWSFFVYFLFGDLSAVRAGELKDLDAFLFQRSFWAFM
jgi:hypothetical protein